MKRFIRFAFFKYFLLIFILLIIFVLFRFFSVREIDDVNSGIKCEEELIKKSDILWVIPLYENKSIAENREWCNYILSLNKTLGMHGVYHTYREFGEIRDEDYINRGTIEFEKCFGYKPLIFKAPQMYLSFYNAKVISGIGLINRGKLSQIFHKVYHCSDTGAFSNRFMDLI